MYKAQLLSERKTSSTSTKLPTPMNGFRDLELE